MKIHEPAMTFLDDEKATLWKEGVAKNQDPYGNAVYRFASEWATRMESELAKGKTLPDIARKCSSEADDECITGYMYGCAVEILAYAWKYGEELRKWHNLETQIGTEGEEANKKGTVLNPALLNIST